MSTGLTHQRLADAERIIRAGLATFVEVGNALMRIREERLYTEDYSTFEAYCQGRWGFSRSRAHRLIEAAEITEAVLPIGNIAPANEGQARELTGLDPATAAEVMETAADSGPVTATSIRDARAKVTGQQQPTRPATWTCPDCGGAFKVEQTHCSTCDDHHPSPEVCTAHHDIVNVETGEIVAAAPAAKPTPRAAEDKPGPLVIASDILARLTALSSRIEFDHDALAAGIAEAEPSIRAGWLNDIARVSDRLTDLHRELTALPMLRRIK